MTSESINIKFSLVKLWQIIKALKEFKGHYNKKFNFSKLMEILNVPDSEVDEIIDLLMIFQDLFKIIFKNYYLEENIIDGIRYLLTKKKESREFCNKKEFVGEFQGLQKKIIFEQNEAKLLSDIIYTFKFIERGKGFDLKCNGSEFLKEVKQLKVKHPYLFIGNGNSLFYPSEIALNIGELILSCEIGNRKLEHIEINYNFDFS